MRLRVAGGQIEVTRDVQANVAAIQRAIDFAAGERADVLVTPEGSLSGYCHDFEPTEVVAALEQVAAQARQARVGLALGTCFLEDGDDKPTNQLRFYSKDGEYLGCHCKILICTGKLDWYISRELRSFCFHEVPIGGLLCNDLWAHPGCTVMDDPHLTQKLSEMGVKVIFHGVNGGRKGDEWSKLIWQFSEANLRLRARAGKVWIVTVDNCHPPDMPCSSPSGIVTPTGDWLCQAKEKGVDYFVATLDLSEHT